MCVLESNIHLQETATRPSLKLEMPDGRWYEVSMGNLAEDPGRVRSEIVRWAKSWGKELETQASLA